MTTARVSLPSPEEMDEAQLAIYNKVVNGPRKMVIGPLRAALLNPSLADRWQAFGQVLRYETSLPAALNELAILVVARHWNSELEWTIHAGEARKAGLSEPVIEAIRTGVLPEFTTRDEAEIYEFSREILENGHVTDACYASIMQRWGDLGVVELTALVGYYSMVAMTLNAHHITLPETIPAELNSTATTRSPLPPVKG